MAKVLSFLKAIPVKILTAIVFIVFGVTWILSSVFSGKKNAVVQKKMDEVLDKIDNKRNNIIVDKVKIETKAEIKVEIIKNDDEKFNTEMTEASKIANKKKKVDELIRIHNQIKKERGK